MSGTPHFIAAAASPLSRFIRFVLSDVALQQQLREIDDTDRFVATVRNIARQRGFDIALETIGAVMRRHPPGGGVEVMPPEELPDAPPEPGWLPIDVFFRHGELWLEWCHFGTVRLTESFFEQSVQRRLRQPFNRLFRRVSRLADLPVRLPRLEHLQPSGFIFHMSRCGSTLVAQMLAALPDTIVVSEAPPIDAVVQASHAASGAEQNASSLAALVHAFGHKRSGGERHFVIKLDAWHTTALPLFRQAFPTVPWIFLYRDPVEVMVSQQQAPGLHMLPRGIGALMYSLEYSFESGNPMEYYARMLANFCEPIVQSTQDGGLLVNYRQLPEAVATTVLPHFGFTSSEGEHALMAAAARYDAKVPGVEFVSDSAERQRIASPAVHDAAKRWLGDVYRRLEAMRSGD